MKTKDFAGAQVKRDQLIFLIRVEIDKWYSMLEQRLYEKRASFNSWMDLGELALTGASALATHTDVKTIYATLSGITKGTHLSIDKNWFQEKATESLINAMRTGRNTQLAAIINKMKDNPANKYTFEEAWGDLITYYQVGTIQGGLVTLAATSGEKVKASEVAVSDANKSRYPPLPNATPAMVAENSKAAVKALALTPDQKRAVLAELKVDIPDGADDAKLSDLMTLAIQEILKNDPAYRKDFLTAVGKQPDPQTPKSPNSMIAENSKAAVKALALTPDQKRAVLAELKVDIPDGADDAKLSDLMTLAIQEIAKNDPAYRKDFLTAVGKQPDPPQTPKSPN